MAGPAIRSVEFARVLAREHDVTLLTAEPSTLRHADFEIMSCSSERDLVGLVKGSDVLIAFGSFLERHPAVGRTDAIIVADLYDPVVLEALVMRELEPMEWRLRYHRGALRALRSQLVRADLFLCASERQRDLVVGMLTSAGRVNPATYDADPMLGGLVRVVPFGVPASPPPAERPGPLRRQLGLGADELLVLWGGGIYEWLDPLLLIEAIAMLDGEGMRAFFLGTAHPTPEVPAMPIVERARARARELGVLDRTVFFGDGWVPYDERAGYLLDADIGVSLHREHIEARYAFRTRILDYLWAGLPIVCSAGDSFAELVQGRGLGEVVEVGDVNGVREALVRLREPERRAACAEPLRAVATELQWDTVLTPVMEFCRFPTRAPDRLAAYRALRRRVDAGDRVHGALGRFVSARRRGTQEN